MDPLYCIGRLPFQWMLMRFTLLPVKIPAAAGAPPAIDGPHVPL